MIRSRADAVGISHGILEQMCRDPARAQRSALRVILAAHAETAFCREHGIMQATSRDDFARRVPVRDYEGHRPWVDRMRAGEADVLVAEPVRFFARTSGTTAAPKWIPITRSWLRAQHAAQALLHEGLMRDVPLLRERPALVMASPASEGSVTGLGLVASGAWHGVIIPTAPSGDAPGSLSERYAAMAEQVRALRPAAIIAASPSSVVALFDAAADKGALYTDALDEVAAIAAWRTGASSWYEGALRTRAPRAELRDVGLAASEGYFTVSTDGSTAAVPMASHHYLELLRDVGEDPIPLEDAVVGHEYRLVVTTPGGLYRYDTEDIVEVVERRQQMPLLSFSRRAGGVSSIAGEKLTEPQLVGAMRECATALAVDVDDFTMEVASSREGAPAYHARVAFRGDDDALALSSRLATELDAALARWNPEYALRRASGRLGSLRIEPVSARHFRELREEWARSGAPDAHYKLLRLRVPWVDGPARRPPIRPG